MAESSRLEASMFGTARSCGMSMSRRVTPRAAALALLLCPLAWTGPAAGQSPPTDSLIEIAAYPLPPRFALRGAAVNDAGSVLYWTDSSAVVVAQSSAGIEIVCRRGLRRPIGAAFVSDGSGVEIVDAGSRAVLRRDGDCHQVFALRAAGEFVSAGRTSSGWVFGLVAPSGAGLVMAVDTAGSETWSTSAQALRAELWDPRLSHLSAAGTGVVLSASRWPFPWLWITRDGSVVAQSDTTSLSRALPATEDWIGLPAVAVGGALVQTIADPRSDQRRIVVYGRDGRVVRVVSL
ncbi:MAG: hypothetical protein AAB409_06655, partial [Gemmatimonadota bacterium]